LLCGNGVVEGDEECDDGNITDRDGCSSVCLTEFAAAGPPTNKSSSSKHK